MFFLTTEKVIIATPEYLAKSDRTIDMSSEELAQDYEVQIKAEMASAAFIKPDTEMASAAFIKPDAGWADPVPPEDMRKHMAIYLASFKGDKGSQDKVYKYISENWQLRILFLEA